MKNVFNNSELAHTWANTTQKSGRSNSMFFEQDGEFSKIYSYGKHFCIGATGSLRTKDDKFLNFTFLNSNSYSTTTAKHQNHVRRAVNDITFRLPFPNNRFEIEYLGIIVTTMKEQIEQLLKAQLKARSTTHNYVQAMGLVKTIGDLCEYFELENYVYSENCLLASQQVENINENKTVREQAKKEREQAKKDKQAIKERENLTNWLNGTYHSQLYNLPVYLRFIEDNKTIQTSHGATVPTREALTMLNKLRNNVECIGERIGNYTIQKVTLDYVKIGCHVIDWSTINKFFSV